MASNPTFKPSRLRRPRRPAEARAAGRRPGRAEAKNYPGLTGRRQVPTRPARRGSRSPRSPRCRSTCSRRTSRSSARRRRLRARQGTVFKNWNPYVNRADDAAGGARGRRATRTSTRSATASTSCRRERARLQDWARALRLRRTDRARRRRRGGRARCRRPRGASRPSTSDWDRAWNPGDSIQLAIGQKDLTVTPLQMARFYAMIANGGKLVTPASRLRGRAARRRRRRRR